MGDRRRYKEYHRNPDIALPRTTAWRLKKKVEEPLGVKTAVDSAKPGI